MKRLTKLYQVVQSDNQVWAHFRTRREAVSYIETLDASNYLGTLTLTIISMWTNKNQIEIIDLLTRKREIILPLMEVVSYD